MVTLSSDTLSVENAKKRSQGNCNRSSCGHPLKWKTRIISAIRDFPHGCCQNPPPAVYMNPQEGDPGLVVPDNVVKPLDVDGVQTSRSTLQCVAHEDVNYSSMEADGVVNKTADSIFQLARGTKIIYDVVVGTQNKTGLDVEALTDAACQLGDRIWTEDVVFRVVGESTVKNKFPQRRVSAERDYPPFCGWNAPEPTDEDRVRIRGSFTVGEKVLVCNGRSTDPMKVHGEKLLGNVHDGADTLVVVQNRSCIVGSIESMKMENEHMKGNVRDSVVHNSEQDLNGFEPKNKFLNLTEKSGDRISDQIVRSDTVNSPDKLLKRKHSYDEIVQKIKCEETGFVTHRTYEDIKPPHPVDVDNLGVKMEERVMVHCLMAAPNCPWRQGKNRARLNKLANELRNSQVKDGDDFSISGGRNVSVNDDSVIVRGLMDASGCPWKQRKDSISDVPSKIEVMNESVVKDRILVHGLVAAPNCPWRRRKRGVSLTCFVDVSSRSEAKKDSVAKDKFPHRRVAAERDYPPFCGWDAPEPTAEDRIRINGRKVLELTCY